MINSLEISGFKSFKSEIIRLGKITVLTGLNNSGKSSILQSIRMCFAAIGSKNPYIDGFGGYGELRSVLSEINSPVNFKISTDLGKKLTLSLLPNRHEVICDFELPFMQYISADRYGPRVSLPLMSEDIQNYTVGHLGQYSAHYATIFENTIVAQAIRHSASISNTLKHQLVRWLGEISPGVRLDFDVLRKYDSSTLAVDDNRPTNSGYGISYTLPIILCLLTMTGEIGTDDSETKLKGWFDQIKANGSVLLIENPEAHLHPRGQTQMGYFIAIAAASGLQIVVETHSDHLLDGIRLAVKEEVGPKSEDVSIAFFNKNDGGESKLENIILKSDGKIERWPKGFFDQFSINLRALSKKNG